jgi:threonine dehydrogenase-like Zn-dependent dehydrogenase
VDVADGRLALAKKFGATDIINSANENAAEAILRLTAGRGADAAFEAVGVTATVELALGCLRKGGAVTLVGNVSPRIDFALQKAVTRELTIYGSCSSRGEYPAALAMLGRGELQPAPLLSAVAPLAEGAAWFQRLYDKEPGLLKVVLRP